MLNVSAKTSEEHDFFRAIIAAPAATPLTLYKKRRAPSTAVDFTEQSVFFAEVRVDIYRRGKVRTRKSRPFQSVEDELVFQESAAAREVMTPYSTLLQKEQVPRALDERQRYVFFVHEAPQAETSVKIL